MLRWPVLMLGLSILLAAGAGGRAVAAAPLQEAVGQGPAPSAVPVSWELEFQFLDPRRVAVQLPGQSKPEVFWYMVYTVVNTSPRTQRFFPTFQLVTEDLQVLDTDRAIPPLVFDTIRERHRLTHPRLVHPTKAIGPLRSGNDYALESVAIWREGDVRVNNFTVYVAGLSGETRFIGGRGQADAGRRTAARRAMLAARRAGAPEPEAEASADSDPPTPDRAAGQPASPADDASPAAEETAPADVEPADRSEPADKGDRAAERDQPARGQDAAPADSASTADAPGSPAGTRKRYVLRKTLEIRYAVPGSPDARLRAEPIRLSVRWVMR